MKEENSNKEENSQDLEDIDTDEKDSETKGSGGIPG